MTSGKSYIVQSGDSLSVIASEQGTSQAELQQLNPIIRDPNKLQVGWKLNLPDKPQPPTADKPAASPAAKPTSAVPAPAALPPAKHQQDTASAKAQCASQCSDELVDVVHVTGDEHFYVLTEEQSSLLKAEIKRVQTLMDEFKQIVSSATDSLSCKKEKNPQASCACIRCKKAEWGKKAEAAGLVKLGPPPPSPAEPPLVTEEDIQGKLRSLQQARDWYETYEPSLVRDGVLGNVMENNWPGLRNAKVRELNAEIAGLRARLASAHVPLSTSADNKPARVLALLKSPCLASRTGATTFPCVTASRCVGRVRCVAPCSMANHSARHWLVSLSRTSRKAWVVMAKPVPWVSWKPS